MKINYVVGSGALDDKPLPLATINDDSNCGIWTFSVIMVGVVGVTADGEEAVPLAVVVGLIKIEKNSFIIPILISYLRMH